MQKRIDMKRVFSSFLLVLTLVILVGCGTNNHDKKLLSSVTKVTVHKSDINVPTLVIVMNWTNIKESGTDIFWHNKIFDISSDGVSSVNRWYANNTNNNIMMLPAHEEYGTINDGVVRVNMGVDHFNKNNDNSDVDNLTIFRNKYVPDAIDKARIAGNIDFATFDKDKNGFISTHELEIIFIVAGGEQSYGGPVPNALWGHSWSFDDNVSAPVIDGVTLLDGSNDSQKKGTYAAFGAQDRDTLTEEHPATVGIMAHEIGHALYNLVDFYDTGNGSGLGYYDIMSNGTWGQNVLYPKAGEAPTQFSAYNKIATSQNVVEESLRGDNIILKCSANEFIKLPTAKPSEYFLVECRDTAKKDSDSSFNFIDPEFTDNRLVATAYHIDEEKLKNLDKGRLPNSENGPQTTLNHYMDSVVQRNKAPLMTDTVGIDIKYSDMYIEGEVLEQSKLRSYAGDISYSVEVLSADYSQRTMSFRILQ